MEVDLVHYAEKKALRLSGDNSTKAARTRTTTSMAVPPVAPNA
jgi:hypothetical protein|tara:strand:- start:957 stop:1085 length:129 start_codon:yes stop_codon:yes gene_type:complete